MNALFEKRWKSETHSKKDAADSGAEGCMP